MIVSASEHLGGQFSRFLYHHAPGEVRSSIRRHGLLPHDPFDPEIHEDRGDAPEGVYMGDLKGEGHSTVLGRHGPASRGHDVWRVDTEGISRIYPDPDDREGYWGFHYTPDRIPPENIKLVRKAKHHPRQGTFSV
jgi:hypothetical protein